MLPEPHYGRGAGGAGLSLSRDEPGRGISTVPKRSVGMLITSAGDVLYSSAPISAAQSVPLNKKSRS